MEEGQSGRAGNNNSSSSSNNNNNNSTGGAQCRRAGMDGWGRREGGMNNIWDVNQAASTSVRRHGGGGHALNPVRRDAWRGRADRNGWRRAGSLDRGAGGWDRNRVGGRGKRGRPAMGQGRLGRRHGMGRQDAQWDAWRMESEGIHAVRQVRVSGLVVEGLKDEWIPWVVGEG